MSVCAVCSRRLLLGSVQFGRAFYKGKGGGKGFGWDRRQGDVEERERERSKNVLDRCPGQIRLMADFLYCGYRDQANSSPDKMSMTKPQKTKTL